MYPHEQQTLPKSILAEQAPAKRSKRRWWLFGVVAFLFVSGGGLLFWNYTPPLTSTEQELVGKWAIPMGPNAPPPNALRIIYEFQSNRQLIVHYEPVAGGTAASEEHTGTWRLDDGQLVMKATGPDTRSFGNKVLNQFGASSTKAESDPEPTRSHLRYVLLGRDGRNLRLQDEAGNELRLEQMDE